MRAAVLAVMVSVAGLLGACASIPESTPVEVVGEDIGSAEEEPSVGPPPPGLDPLSVVRRFVEASASQANEHQAVRAYLTSDAARTWNDAAATYVIDDQFDTAPTEANPLDADQRRMVELRTRQLGQVDPAGVFQLDRREQKFTVNLVREGGEWRITNPPSGLLMRVIDFNSSHRAVSLAYVDASSNMLVSDRRWVRSRPESALPDRVIGLLLGEPSDDLAGAVISELRGARTRTNVARGADGLLTVDLTGVQELNETQRELAAAQIVRSLDEHIAATEQVRIRVDEQALVPDREQWRPVDAERFEPVVDLSPGLPGLVVTGEGRVFQINSREELSGVGPLEVRSIAQSSNGERLAVVALDGGRPRLLVGGRGALQPVDLPATTMSEPTWRRGEVWVVVDGSRLMAVTTDGGTPRAHAVDVSPELTRQGRISELRVSRDGVRVAAIVNNALMLGSVTGVGPQSGVRNIRQLPPPKPTQLVDVDWVGTDRLVMATASPDTPVYETSVDGLTWRPFGTSNLTPPITRIAAVLGRPVLVADQNGVWSALTASSVWQPVGYGAGAVPVYPG